MRRKILSFAAVLIVITQLACFNFSGQLRIILAASGPLIESLPLNPKLKTGLIADFAELANGAITMDEDFKACGKSKPCRLNAVVKFEATFETVEARGHFGVHSKLKTVEGILKGLIASARIYYDDNSPQLSKSRKSKAVPPTENDIKAQLNDLRDAMRP